MSDVTRLLQEWQDGRADASGELLALVYSELRSMAARQMRNESSGHTLQPTALVHEAYLRLVDQKNTSFQNRAHFLNVAAQAMRRILIDHARRRQAAKREGGERVTLEDDARATPGPSLDLLALDAALSQLATLDPRQARVVELRFFGGLEVEEVAEALGSCFVTHSRRPPNPIWPAGVLAPIRWCA